MEWFLNRQIWNMLQEQLAAKQDSPENEGSAGQVLGLAFRDGHLVPVWITVSGGGITIDDALSNISENPVQNKVITSAINQKLDKPPTAGTSGQVLTSDGQGGQAWDDLPADPVTDVQVNGTSVVNQGVAEIPIAAYNQLGLASTNPNYGIGASGGRLITAQPSETQIKNADSAYRPITPANQHLATFYGLAKVASDTTQSASSNPVGTYTDDAKKAILSMLGVLMKRQSVSVSLTINAGDQSLVTIPNITGYIPVFIRLVFTSSSGAAHKLCVSGLIYQSSENRIRIFNTDASGSATFTGSLQVYYLPATAYEEVV